jgi:hypothetical protein
MSHKAPNIEQLRGFIARQQKRLDEMEQVPEVDRAERWDELLGLAGRLLAELEEIAGVTGAIKND